MIAPHIHLNTTLSRPRVIIEGTWAGVHLGEAEALLDHEFIQYQVKDFDLILNDAILDTNGARLIVSRLSAYRYVPKGSPEILELLEKMKQFAGRKPIECISNPWYWQMLEDLGRFTVTLIQWAHQLLSFFGEVVVTLVSTLKQLRWVSIIKHVEEFGIKALPIIALTSFLIGMVLAYQGINQLSRFGAELFTVDFLGIGILREIGVLLTSIVIAGRSGSAITAQIGTMKLNQEIDALQTMGLTPMVTLVIPRILGLLIALPILVFFSDIIALLGGMFMTKLGMGLSANEYLAQLQKAVTPAHFWVGMSKTPLFAIVISMIGCFRGFQVAGSAESIGKMTTRSVVESIFLVIVIDALMSIMYSYLKI